MIVFLETCGDTQDGQYARGAIGTLAALCAQPRIARLQPQARDARGAVAEWVVLRELYDRDPMAPSELATRLGMTRGAISKLADRLVAKSFLTRTSNAGDRRFQALALTPAGRALTPELAVRADQNDAEFFDHLEPKQRAAIEGAMKEIVKRRGLRTIPMTAAAMRSPMRRRATKTRRQLEPAMSR